MAHVGFVKLVLDFVLLSTLAKFWIVMEECKFEDPFDFTLFEELLDVESKVGMLDMMPLGVEDYLDLYDLGPIDLMYFLD